MDVRHFMKVNLLLLCLINYIRLIIYQKFIALHVAHAFEGILFGKA